MSSTTITISPADLESLVRKVVKEELNRQTAILHDWRHEGPDDPEEDEQLLHEALARLEEARQDPDSVMSLEDFQEELAQAEAAGELPD